MQLEGRYGTDTKLELHSPTGQSFQNRKPVKASLEFMIWEYK